MERHDRRCRNYALARSWRLCRPIAAAEPHAGSATRWVLSIIHISEPTRQAEISYAASYMKKK